MRDYSEPVPRRLPVEVTITYQDLRQLIEMCNMAGKIKAVGKRWSKKDIEKVMQHLNCVRVKLDRLMYRAVKYELEEKTR